MEQTGRRQASVWSGRRVWSYEAVQFSATFF